MKVPKVDGCGLNLLFIAVGEVGVVTPEKSESEKDYMVASKEGDVGEVGKCEGLKRKFRIIADATVVRSLDKGREESSMCKEENCKTSVESSSKYCIGSWKG